MPALPSSVIEPGLEQLCLEAYDKIVGLDLADLTVDGWIAKAPCQGPCGGEAAGTSPVDRGKQGTKRSLMVEARGVPVGCVVAGAHRNDSPLLRPTLAKLARFDEGLGSGLPTEITVHLDAGYDSGKTRDLLDEMGCHGLISAKGPRCRRASAGSSSAPTPGTTAASRNSPSAPNDEPASSRPSSHSRTP